MAAVLSELIYLFRHAVDRCKLLISKRIYGFLRAMLFRTSHVIPQFCGIYQ